MRKITLLLLVLSSALILRMFQLGSKPLGFTWDEAAIGYNAYSLVLTGRDEHQKILPVVFKSFGDFKPGLYIYFTVPSVMAVGLNEFATRLPSAIFGTVLVALMYIWTRNIWTALLMAINPWAIHFSRGAWEANLALCLTVLGLALLHKKKYYLAAGFLGLTFWSYQGAKLFTPLIVLTYFLLYKPDLKKIFRPFILLLVLLLPIALGLGSQTGRLKVFSVFSYVRRVENIQEILHQDGNNQIWLNLFHSEIFEQIRGVSQRYLNYFSPRFFFFEGDWTNLRHALPYHGYFYVLEIVTLSLGLIMTIKRWDKFGQFIILWLLIAPIPAALSRDLVSGVRALPMVIPLVVISGLGLSSLAKHRIYLGFFGLLLAGSLIRYLDLYYVHYHKFAAQDWLSAYKTAWEIVLREQTNYRKIIFTDKLGQPYIFGLFYGKIRPQDYWASYQMKDSAQGDVGQVISFGKYEFRPIYWPVDRDLSSTLFVGGQYELPEKDIDNSSKIADITYPNGDYALKIVGKP